MADRYSILKKVGPQKAAILKQYANIHTYEDLLLFFPRRYVDRSNLLKINNLVPYENEFITLIGKFSQFQIVQSANKKSRLTAIFSDGSGYAQIHWFQGIEWIKKTL
ncbi:MAG: hypothetical protein KatS3mg083_579 [Candidatus Dojkabacteria bacterium]|nr:MAG: hypothetical protein KatS3mg083_579 [Candidatus Dojkabacteria bacterium]